MWATDLDAVRVVVEEQDAGAGHFLRLHHRLEVGQKAHVLRHVGGQNLMALTKKKTTEQYEKKTTQKSQFQ